MFKLCLFDLDDTLLRTADLKIIREAGKNINTAEYLLQLKNDIGDINKRRVYPQAVLQQIRTQIKDIKLGVFTRAPRSYADFFLNLAYPGFEWDIIIAYENVKPTKPYGAGIDKAMKECGIRYLSEIALVGDNDADVKSAYNGGCYIVLDKGSWPYKWDFTHWSAIEHMADAIINSPASLINVLTERNSFLPELERALENGLQRYPARFDKISHFIPTAIGGKNSPFTIFVSGRSFAKYESVQRRRRNHKLTESIENNKDSIIFPDEWIKTVRIFIEQQCCGVFGPFRIKVAVVPHRPGRKPRLEKFLAQLEASFQAHSIINIDVSFHPELLAYKHGVKSQHNEYLGSDERFTNVRDHLYVQQPEHVEARSTFLIIDDVTTTGASLIYASKYLKDKGATNVICLSMAKNIGNLYPYK